MKKKSAPPERAPLSNAEIAHHLSSLAQLLAAQGDNPFKIRAYRAGLEPRDILNCLPWPKLQRMLRR